MWFVNIFFRFYTSLDVNARNIIMYANLKCLSWTFNTVVISDVFKTVMIQAEKLVVYIKTFENSRSMMPHFFTLNTSLEI